MRAVTLVFVGVLLSGGAAARAFAEAAPAPTKVKAKASVKASASTPAAAPASAPAAEPAATAPATPAAPVAAETPPAASPATPPPDAAPAAATPGPTQAVPTTPPPPPPSSTPPPPSYGPPPGEPPPAPYYPRLGGEPEPEVEKGDWDPWEHPTASSASHHGFYLRLAIGIGGGSVWGGNHVLPDVKKLSLSGLGFGTSIAVGGSIAENLILNADLFQATLFNPSVRQDGHRLGSASKLNRDFGVGEDVTIAGLGVGLTYYFMPVNVYLSGSLGFGQAVFDDFNGDRSGSDFGLASNIMVGKEWFVGPDWGIGVAGQLVLLTTHDDILGSLGAAAFNVMFSATYN